MSEVRTTGIEHDRRTQHEHDRRTVRAHVRPEYLAIHTLVTILHPSKLPFIDFASTPKQRPPLRFVN